MDQRTGPGKGETLGCPSGSLGLGQGPRKQRFKFPGSIGCVAALRRLKGSPSRRGPVCGSHSHGKQLYLRVIMQHLPAAFPAQKDFLIIGLIGST